MWIDKERVCKTDTHTHTQECLVGLQTRMQSKFDCHLFTRVFFFLFLSTNTLWGEVQLLDASLFQQFAAGWELSIYEHSVIVSSRNFDEITWFSFVYYLYSNYVSSWDGIKKMPTLRISSQFIVHSTCASYLQGVFSILKWILLNRTATEAYWGVRA